MEKYEKSFVWKMESESGKENIDKNDKSNLVKGIWYWRAKTIDIKYRTLTESPPI